MNRRRSRSSRVGEYGSPGGLCPAPGPARQRSWAEIDAGAADVSAAAGDRDGFPEVIRDNHAAVALYQSLGFTRRYGLCGYLSAEPLAAAPGVLQPYPIPHCFDAPLRRVTVSSRLMDPLTFATLPCRVVTGTARLRGTEHLGLTACTAVFMGGTRRPSPWAGASAADGAGAAVPGIGTSVTVPETFTPLFAAAGYAPLSLQQYEMTMECAAAKSA